MYLGHKEIKNIHNIAEDAILRWIPRPIERKIEQITEYGFGGYSKQSLYKYCDSYITRSEQEVQEDEFVIAYRGKYNNKLFDTVKTFIVEVDFGNDTTPKRKQRRIDKIIKIVEDKFDFYTLGDKDNTFMIVGCRKNR